MPLKVLEKWTNKFMRSLHLQKKKTVELTSTKWLKGDGRISAPLFFLFTQS